MVFSRKFIIGFLIVASVMFTSFFFYVWQVLYTPNFLLGRQDRYLFIHKDMTFKQLQDTLYYQDYVHELMSFSVLAKIMDLDKVLKPGQYRIDSEMTNLEVIRLLRAGIQEPTTITFNNVRLKEDLAKKITQKIALKPDEFLAVLQNGVFISELGFNSENIMSMFLPNTYQVYWTISAEELMRRMHAEYKRFWNSDRLAKAESIGLSSTEVSALASIVQAESIMNDERPKIAGVYLNRLKRGMKLQADPTVVFAIGDFEIKRVLNVHKEIDSPYNTYKYTGLPPGPINLPEISSIDAVLNAESHNYLYFCAKEDFSGYHNFATNLQAHNTNAARYQRALNQARIYK